MVSDMEIPKGYKQTEVGVIPEDWEVDYIQNLAQITTGAKNTQDKVDAGIYPFFVRSQTVERINTYCFDGEAVLTAGDGVGTGKIFHYIDGRFDFHQRVYKISNFSNLLNGYYFYLYFSRYFYSRIAQMTAKSSVDSVRRDMIAEMTIILPTKSEQTAIANALNDADSLITALSKLIEKKKAIKQGAMQELLRPKKGWEVKKLGEICKTITTGKLDANAMEPNGTYRFYTCAKDYYFIDTYAFDAEALLISGNGENVGYVHYYNGKFNAYQRTYVLTGFNQNILYVKKYLDVFLSKRIDVEVNLGNTPYIKMGTLTEMDIFFPTPSEQTRIAQILSDMDTEIESLQKKLEKYKLIKQGMMQSLLTGKVRLI